ncbi:hypothetical protein AB0G32_35005 [Streptomyces sp. NPDC023723]|uniref:hypothetical protein n=1 Tax=Streptomyces sp. NPDC023723 TaxID=3154323 RepID=UPI0033CE0DEA
MAGRIFGHHLGLPGALSGLPSSPLVPGYAELAAAQHAAGARHAAEILLPSGGGLRVLDGLEVPSGPRGRRRVDGALLDQVAGGAGPAAELARLLAAVHRRDPRALRRVVLYQLIGLVQDRPPDQWQQVVAELGIHPGEAAGLLAAARLRPVLDPGQRAAAEALADAWAERRLHRARGLLERLPQSDDPELRALRAELAGRLATLETALETARHAARRGAAAAATEQYLRALGEAADDRRALHGLVRTHRPEPGRPAALRAELALDGVALAWDADGAESWRLLCLLRDERGGTGHREVPALTGTARDTAVVPGGTVRYAALPLRDGQVSGPPLVSHRLPVTPEVGTPDLADGPGRVTCGWTCPPGTTSVTVEHRGPESATERLDADADGFTATGLAVGTHAFRVSCHYRAPDGTPVASPGRLLTRTVHPWPEPVGTLSAEPDGDVLRFTWTGARDADVRLVEWPGAAPAAGTELRTDELPARLDGLGDPAGTGPADDAGPSPRPAGNPTRTVRPRRGGQLRIAAVAVRGERALAGPAVGVEAPAPVTALAARRLPAGEAAVTLEWPAGTGQVTVAWEPLPGPEVTAAGEGGERTVTAHAYRRGGLRLPVGPHAVRVRASVAPQVPGAVLLPAEPAEVLLAADTAIGYQLVRAPRRFRSRGRRRPLLRVTLLGPDPAGADLPEFVCVVRGGTLRPRHASDGATVLRVAGSDLTRHGGTVEQELPAAPFPAPYTLRGFLLGEHATAVRLEEPSPATLVVR